MSNKTERFEEPAKLLEQRAKWLEVHHSKPDDAANHREAAALLRQEGLSAATHPDVEQMAEEAALKKYPPQNNGTILTKQREAFEEAFIQGYQAGQSAVQDATPQDKLEWETLDATDYKDATAFYFECFYRTDGQAKAFQKELSTLRSELSAAQEENKRMREKIDKYEHPF